MTNAMNTSVRRFLYTAADLAGIVAVAAQGYKLSMAVFGKPTIVLESSTWSAYNRIRTIFGGSASTYNYVAREYRMVPMVSANDYVVFRFAGVRFLAVAVKSEKGGSRTLIYTLRKNQKELSELATFLNRFSLMTETRQLAEPIVKVTKDGAPSVMTKTKDWDSPPLDGIPIHTKVRERLDKHIAFLHKNWNSSDKEKRRVSRGLLLSGSKGSGKTSIAYAMAVELSLRPVIFPDAATHADFWTIADTIPIQAMVLFDDAESMAVFKKRDPNKEDPAFENTPARPRDMFSFLSGPRSCPSVLTMVITNYPERLSETAVRTGRIKEEIKVNEVDHLGIKRFLEYTFSRKIPDDIIFPERLAMDIFDIIEDYPDYEGAIAELQKAPRGKEICED